LRNASCFRSYYGQPRTSSLDQCPGKIIHPRRVHKDIVLAVQSRQFCMGYRAMEADIVQMPLLREGPQPTLLGTASRNSEARLRNLLLHNTERSLYTLDVIHRFQISSD